MGVAVFDGRTGAPVSFNLEAARIVGGLQPPGQPLEHLLEVVTVRRQDGREISLAEFPLAQVLKTGETVRTEEIVIEMPDGRSVTTLVNATPIYSEESGELDSVVVTLHDMTPLEELERLRAEFLAIVSHELRTPLAAIRGCGHHHVGRRVGAGPCRDAPVPPHHRRAGRPHARTDKRPARRCSY